MIQGCYTSYASKRSRRFIYWRTLKYLRRVLTRFSTTVISFTRTSCDDQSCLKTRDSIRSPIQGPQPTLYLPAKSAEEKGISHLIWIGITARQAYDNKYRLDNGLIDWQSLRPEEDYNSFSWDESYLSYTRHTLDIPLPAFKTVAGLLRLLKWLFSAELTNYSPERFRIGAAFSFAMASSLPAGNDSEFDPEGGSNGCGIGPLSTSLYVNNPDDDVPPSDDHDDFEFGQWAILLIHEAFDAKNQETLEKWQHARNPELSVRAIKRLRYALVTPSIKRNPTDRDFMVADIPTYVKHVRSKASNKDKGNDGELQSLIKVWNTGIAAIDSVDFYGDEDIYDILPRVFPNHKASQQGSNPE